MRIRGNPNEIIHKTVKSTQDYKKINNSKCAGCSRKIVFLFHKLLPL